MSMGDYFVVSFPTKGLAAVIRGPQPKSSTGKALYGANARRRLQARRKLAVMGINRSAYTFWKSTVPNSVGRAFDRDFFDMVRDL